MNIFNKIKIFFQQNKRLEQLIEEAKKLDSRSRQLDFETQLLDKKEQELLQKENDIQYWKEELECKKKRLEELEKDLEQQNTSIQESSAKLRELGKLCEKNRVPNKLKEKMDGILQSHDGKECLNRGMGYGIKRKKAENKFMIGALPTNLHVLNDQSVRICDLPENPAIVKKKTPKNPPKYGYRIGSLPTNTMYTDSNIQGRICDLPDDEEF